MKSSHRRCVSAVRLCAGSECALLALAVATCERWPIASHSFLLALSGVSPREGPALAEPSVTEIAALVWQSLRSKTICRASCTVRAASVRGLSARQVHQLNTLSKENLAYFAGSICNCSISEKGSHGTRAIPPRCRAHRSRERSRRIPLSRWRSRRRCAEFHYRERSISPRP
jgi:hypothetical protein